MWAAHHEVLDGGPLPDAATLAGLLATAPTERPAEGKNVILEYRYADGKLDLLPELAADLVRLKVDAIVTRSTAPIRAAKNDPHCLGHGAAAPEELLERDLERLLHGDPVAVGGDVALELAASPPLRSRSLGGASFPAIDGASTVVGI